MEATSTPEIKRIRLELEVRQEKKRGIENRKCQKNFFDGDKVNDQRQSSNAIKKENKKCKTNTKDKPITTRPAREPVKKQAVGLNKSEDKLVSKPRPTVKTTAEKNKANASLTTTKAGRQKVVIRKPIWFGHQAESGELACFALCRLTFFQLFQNT
jgi:hypothetical protein